MSRWLCGLLCACHGVAVPADGPTSDSFVQLDADPLCSAAPTFTNVQQVLAACTSCHSLGAPLDLRPSVAYANLVGQPPVNYTDPVTDESCGVILVKAGDATGSYLFQKISLAMPCAGAQMPLGEVALPLDGCRQSLIHDWIDAGAVND